MKASKWTWIIRLIVLAMAIGSTVWLYRLHTQISQNKARAEQLSQKATELEQENKRLQEDIDALQTEDGVKDVARKELGMVASGEIVFRDVGE